MDNAPRPNRGLGKGLESLIAPKAQSARRGALVRDTAARDANAGGTRYVAVDTLRPGRYQPREHFDEAALQELADSIVSAGLIQPIIVHAPVDGVYEIIAGERRSRAARMAGLREVPVIIKTGIDNDRLMAIALIENIQRADLNPIEAALGFQRLRDEFDIKHEEVARMVGRSRPFISNALRLLELVPAVQAMLRNGELQMGHGRALLPLPADAQLEAAKRAIAERWSVRQVEQHVNEKLGRANKTIATKTPPPDAEAIGALSDALRVHFAREVRIKQAQSGKGEVVIPFADIHALHALCAELTGDTARAN